MECGLCAFRHGRGQCKNRRRSLTSMKSSPIRRKTTDLATDDAWVWQAVNFRSWKGEQKRRQVEIAGGWTEDISMHGVIGCTAFLSASNTAHNTHSSRHRRVLSVPVLRLVHLPGHKPSPPPPHCDRSKDSSVNRTDVGPRLNDAIPQRQHSLFVTVARLRDVSS